MNIAVVGNREGWAYQQVEKTLDELGMYHSDIIITGGADGVDTFVQEYAKKHGNRCYIIYPKPSLSSPQRYYQRNKEIAIMCDILVSFNKKEKSGTSNTIRYAKELNKQVIEIGADLKFNQLINNTEVKK